MGAPRRAILLLTSALASAAVAAPSFAEQQSETSIAEVVVTARRVEERLQDVPISMTVLSQQQLTNRNIINAGELGAFVPSLSTNSRFGAEKTSFALRGFNQDSVTSPTVGVYFADTVAPRSGGGTASGNGAGAGAFFDLQNVQVLKGPQGTLFGRNTTGGAILLVPQKPTREFEGYVEGSLGNYDMRRFQAVANVPVNDRVRLRFGMDRNVRDGYLRNQSGVGERDFADVDYTALRASAVVDVTEDIENYTVANYSQSDTHGGLLRLTQCQRNPALRVGRIAFTALAGCNQLDRQAARGDGYYDVESGLTNSFVDTEQWQVINTTAWRASQALTVKNIMSYGEFREKLAFNINGDNFTVTSGPFTGRPFQTNVVYSAPGGYSASQSTFTEELQFQGRTSDDRLVWQAGGYLEISDPQGPNAVWTSSLLNCADALNLQCESYFGTAAALAPSYVTLAFRSLGAYAQATYKFTDKLSVTAGLRYTSDKTKGTGERLVLSFPTPNNPVGACANTILFPGRVTRNPQDCHVQYTQKSSKPTWLIDFDYKPTTDVLLYAKYARGYRQGGVNPNAFGFETWQPEKVDSYEVGAKTSFEGPVRGYFNIAAFWNDFRDQQLNVVTVPKPTSGLSGGTVIVNAGKSRIRGIEADAAVTPFEGLDISASYAYLDTLLQSFSPAPLDPASPYASLLVRDEVGGVLTLAPKNRVTATATYTLPLSADIGRISVSATYTHTSSQVATISSPFGRLPASHLLNLNLNWNSVGGSPIDLGFFATNVTKQKFPLNIAGTFASSGVESEVTNQPRMYGLRLRYRWE